VGEEVAEANVELVSLPELRQVGGSAIVQIQQAALLLERDGGADYGLCDGCDQEDGLTVGGFAAMLGVGFAVAGVDSQYRGGQVVPGTRVLQNLYGPVEAGAQITHYVLLGDFDGKEFEIEIALSALPAQTHLAVANGIGGRTLEFPPGDRHMVHRPRHSYGRCEPLWNQVYPFPWRRPGLPRPASTG
jgi:hypothetical protein